MSMIDDIKLTYEKLLNEGKIPGTEILQQKYKLFADKFGPEKLKNLDGELLLDTIFNFGTRDSLIYWLEFKNDEDFDTSLFGSVAGGSSFKYIMYKRNSDGRWVTGNPQNPRILTTTEAIEIGREIRNKLIAGADAVVAIKNSTDDNKYEYLADSLEKVLSISNSNTNMSRLGWVHKYYHMIFPDIIDAFHTTLWQRHGLICCGIKPEGESLYVMAGQFVKLAKESDLATVYIKDAIKELYGYPVSYYRIGTSNGNISYWNEMKDSGYVSIGWSKIGDIKRYEELNRTELKEKLTEILRREYPNSSAVISKSANQLLTFYLNIKPQDVIVAVNGERVLGVGQAVGGYEYREGLAFPHIIEVDWYYKAETRLPNTMEGLRTTVYQYKDIDNLLEIERLANIEYDPEDDGIKPPTVSPLSGITQQIENILNRKKQVILYGPPGTGKTYNAEKACFELAARHNFKKTFFDLTEDEKMQICGNDKNKGAVRMCCFHPYYGYEDFIEGIKPSVSNGQTVFDVMDGIFKELCKDAEKELSKNFYFIIDEINRGDISKVFGELIMLIEADKRGKRLILPFSKNQFTVPDNVYIVGTMNTADRSIALLDVALRRRFGFIELMPEYSFFKGVVFDGLPLDEWLKSLNKRICENIGKDARNLQIGHSYFLEGGKAVTNSDKFKSIVKEDVIPLIEEYCYGDYSLMAKILGEGIVDTRNQSVKYELFSPADTSDLINALLSPCPELRAAIEDESLNTELSDNVEAESDAEGDA